MHFYIKKSGSSDYLGTYSSEEIRAQLKAGTLTRNDEFLEAAGQSEHTLNSSKEWAKIGESFKETDAPSASSTMDSSVTKCSGKDQTDGTTTDGPHESTHLLEQAKKLYTSGKLSESEAQFQKLIDSGQREPESTYFLGLIRFNRGDLDAASNLFGKATKLDPNNANAYYYLAEILRLRGEPEKARDFYKKTCEINPHHEAAVTRLLPPGFYSLLRADPAQTSKHALRLIQSLDNRVCNVTPRFSAFFGKILIRICIVVMLVILLSAVAKLFENLSSAFVSATSAFVSATSAQWAATAPYLIGSAVVIAAAKLGKWLNTGSWIRMQVSERVFLAIFCFTYLTLLHSLSPLMTFAIILLCVVYYLKWINNLRITIHEGRLEILSGVFGRHAQNVELYRVMDLELRQTYLNRFTGDGSIILFVEGIHGHREAVSVELTGVGKIDDLRQIFEQLRNLVLLLRSGTWGKGIIY